MKGKEGFGYFKGRKKNQKKCELAKKLRVGLIKKPSCDAATIAVLLLRTCPVESARQP